MENTKFNLFSFQAEYKILHLTWLAFFMSFAVWLSVGPMMPFIQEYFDLSKQQAQTLLILNIAMTIPARVIVGILVDHFGPKIIFSGILVLGGLISIFFSWAQTYEQLAFMRFLSGFIGAGFVVGIRIIAEWFPAHKNGTAQGIYGGFGNFGSAAAAIILPFLAVLWAENGWRIAITLISLVAIIYGIFYYFNVSNTPKNSTYLKPKKSGVMEVNSLKDLILYSITNSFIYLALAIIVWKLSPNNMALLSDFWANITYIILLLILIFNTFKIWQANKVFIKNPPKFQSYKFKQVAVLKASYFVTFGAELALVSILALFYAEWFGVSKFYAALLSGIYPFLNLFSRPLGGFISDKIGRKLTIIIAFSGISVVFLTLGLLDKSWPIWLVVALSIAGGIFSQAGSGAVFAIAPLIQKRLTGQIAGMVGAFGNIGAVVFLTINSFVEYDKFFLFIGISGFFVLALIILLLENPQKQTVNPQADGNI